MSKIDDLLADPKFKQLMVQNPDRARAFVMEMKQHDFGVVPETNNFLESAIKNSRIGPYGGTSITAAVPSNNNELNDLGKVIGRQIPMTRGQDVNFATTGPVGIGLNLAGINKAEPLISPPDTQYGKNLESSADIGQMVVPSMELAGMAKNGIGNIINKFRTSPIKKEIKGIEDLILQSKNSESNVQGELGKIKDTIKSTKESGSKAAEETAYTGAKAIKEQKVGRFRDANQRFGEEFSKLQSQMGDEDLAKVIKNAANDIGAADVPGTPGNTLMNQIKKFGPKSSPEGVDQFQPRIYDKKQVQAITKEILDSLPDERSKAIFHKHLIDALPESVPGLKELKASHASVYKIAKESKSLTKGALKRVATGSASDTEVNDLSQIGERLGSSHVERAKRVASKNKLQQSILEQSRRNNEQKLLAKKQEQEFLGSKLKDSEKELIKRLGRKNWAIGAGTASVGLPLVGSLLKHFFVKKED